MSQPPKSVIEHLRAPANAGELEDADAVGRGSVDGRAPFITIYLQVEADRIARATFGAYGCGYAIACGSALTELLLGKSAEECQAVTAADLSATLGGLPGHKAHCAEIAVQALHDALRKLREQAHGKHSR